MRVPLRSRIASGVQVECRFKRDLSGATKPTIAASTVSDIADPQHRALAPAGGYWRMTVREGIRVVLEFDLTFRVRDTPIWSDAT